MEENQDQDESFLVGGDHTHMDYSIQEIVVVEENLAEVVIGLGVAALEMKLAV